MPVRVGGVLDDDHVGFVVQHFDQCMGGVALGGGDDFAAVLGVVVGRVGIKGSRPGRAEVARQGLGGAHGPADGKALAIRGRQVSATSVSGQPLAVLLVDHSGGSRPQLLLAQELVGGPPDGLVFQACAAGHVGQRNVAGRRPGQAHRSAQGARR